MYDNSKKPNELQNLNLISFIGGGGGIYKGEI